jgi:DNA-binding GntR family transcriptional regulator
MNVAPPSFRTKREIAVATLRDAILSGRYAPGQQLRQAQLVSDLGLGSTPVREAVLELLARGLLVQESHHSVRVADLDLERIRATYRVRALLETEAARLGTANLSSEEAHRLEELCRRMEEAMRQDDLDAVRTADDAFHRTLYEAAGNPVLVSLIEQLWAAFPRYLLWAIPGRVAGSLAEHRGILDAILAGKAEAAAAAVGRHLLAGLAALEAHVKREGPTNRNPVARESRPS